MNPAATNHCVTEMQAAGIPADEPQRLATLRGLQLLDTEPSNSFDRITRMLARLLDVPMALVSLVDENRQWFKSKVGLSARETSRDVSFCAHAVFNREALVVADATQDVRFAGNPLVTGAPHIRAYAGIPIFSKHGFAIGTLCAVDVRPRTFDADALQSLNDCCKIVEELVHARELANGTEDVLKFATERERLFRDTFEQAAVGMMHTDSSGRLLQVNQRLCGMLGRTDLQLRSRSLLEITHQDDVSASRIRWRHMMAGELDTYRLETRLQKDDETYLWTEISVALSRSTDGPPYAIVVIEDISDTKRAAAELCEARDSLRSQVTLLSEKIQELERSEERFRCLVRLTSQVIWTNSAEGRMEGEQPGWAAFTGQTFDTYQDFGWAAAVHPDDAQPTIDEWNRSVLERRPFLFEHRVRRHDGVYRTCTIDAAPVLNDDGTIREWVGVHNDITERRRQEEEIRVQEAHFRFLAESVPQMVWTSRPDGIADYYNRNWYSYTGMTREQTETGAWGPIHPDDFGNSVRVWRHSVATGAPYQVEQRFRRSSDGAYRWHLCRALRLSDERGETAKWFGTCTDIHDYKEAEAKNLSLQAELEDRVQQRTAELEMANRDLKAFSAKLERSNRELQDFASVASHDLQEPLRKVQTFGDRLKAACGSALDEQGRDYLGRMLGATNRMQGLIHDLLTFSRVNSRPRSFVPVDLGQVAREVLSDLEIRIAETTAQVRLDSLPSIDADPMLMRQLLQNLIGNALKFHKVGRSPVVQIRASVHQDRDAAREMCALVIEDDGIGFDEKYLDRIFTVFQRLHGRNEYEGTGVGLAICRKIAWRHGGEITAHSAPGRGASFIVTLPKHQTSDHMSALEDSHQTQARLKILPDSVQRTTL